MRPVPLRLRADRGVPSALMVDGTDSTDSPQPHAVSEPGYGDFPLKRYLGMELTGDEPGVGVATVDVGADHLNPNGVVHGAVLFALVDTAMGKSTMFVID